MPIAFAMRLSFSCTNVTDRFADFHWHSHSIDYKQVNVGNDASGDHDGHQVFKAFSNRCAIWLSTRLECPRRKSLTYYAPATRHFSQMAVSQNSSVQKFGDAFQ
jgi:hypothetical protein